MQARFGFCLLVLAVLSSAGVAAAAEPKAINIGWTGGSAWTALPDRVAMERGFFEKEGLKPRYIQFQGTNLMLNALMSSELDYVTILPFISGAATRGLPVKIVAATAKASGYAIISRPDIDSVKALKGKRIAINTFGSSADFAIYQLLVRNGLDPNKDVTLLSVAGSPDARFAALIGGSVDATVVNSPFEYRAEQRGFKTLLSMKEIGRVRPYSHKRFEHVAAKNRPRSRRNRADAAGAAQCDFISAEPARNQRRPRGETVETRPPGGRALLRPLSRTVQPRSDRSRFGGGGMDCDRNFQSQGKNHGQTTPGRRLELRRKSPPVKSLKVHLETGAVRPAISAPVIRFNNQPVDKGGSTLPFYVVQAKALLFCGI